MKRLWSLLKETATAWSRHNAPSMGAALAYYTILSMAPLVIISIAIAGCFFTRADVQGQVLYQVQSTVGPAGAEVIQSVLKNASQPSSGLVASGISLLMLLIGASGVFTELRTSLNRIWDVPAGSGTASLSATVRFYIFSLALVLSVGFLLLVSLILSAVLALFEQWLSKRLSSLPITIHLFNVGLSLIVIALLFALIYKFLPDASVRWSDVWHGAIATAILFTVGKFALALYIARMSVGSAYGAAGSLIVLLVWIYYSAQIFLFGAEFTHIYSQHSAKSAARLAA